MSALPGIVTKLFNDSDEVDNPALRTALIALVAVAVGVAVLSLAAGPAWAVAILWAIASLASGGILGFLFGVPKVLQDDTRKTGGYRQVVNTNLDQISDWLTKVVVGLTLVNARNLAESLRGTAQILANALGEGDAQLAVAMAAIVYFAAIGFLGTYILTRLYLAQAFYLGDQPRDAAQRVAGLLTRADAEETAGRADEAKKLRAQALAETRTAGETGA
jgi:hypothetical protein